LVRCRAGPKGVADRFLPPRKTSVRYSPYRSSSTSPGLTSIFIDAWGNLLVLSHGNQYASSSVFIAERHPENTIRTRLSTRSPWREHASRREPSHQEGR
jgi:hypothetical protein